MLATDPFGALDAQLAELRRLIGTARGLCYTARPEEDRPMTARHEAAAPPDPTPCAVHVKRADGLDVEVSGSSTFVTATLERILTVLGVIQAPPA
jgi:hypothetical protein